MGVRRRWSIVLVAVAAGALLAPAIASGHGEASEAYKVELDSIEPKGLPLDIRVENADELRVENVGDKELVLCGYMGEPPKECERYARIGPAGVYVNHGTSSYYANLDTERFGEIPPDLDASKEKWKLERREPPFFRYHDHRLHWMGPPGSVPPGVDDTDPTPQLVSRFKIGMRYGTTPVIVEGRLIYTGGQTWFQRYGEYALTGGAVILLIVLFAIDARRRRRAREPRDPDVPPQRGAGSAARAERTATILEPEAKA